jgi:GAF domain-containing protein
MELVRIGDAELDASLDRLLRTAAETLEVGRVSVWLLEAEGDEIVCRDLYLADEGCHQAGQRVRRAKNPAYFRALSEERILAAHDAASDPRTRDFAETYLRPAGITSMLDAPIWRKGELVGVLCHEHVGPARRWSQEDQEFASTVADMVSLSLEEGEVAGGVDLSRLRSPRGDPGGDRRPPRRHGADPSRRGVARLGGQLPRAL